MTTTRQTQSYLRNLFEERGLHLKAKLGQNFLVDLNLLDVLVEAAELTRNDLVLEIGTGTGSLTTRLAALAGAVLGIELDLPFFELTREATAGLANVFLLHGDVLKGKNEINPRVFGCLADVKRRTNCDSPAAPCPLKLVANLPFAAATPVIANLLLSDECFERMVVTVQWEIAERLAAAPGSKDYGALSVLVQSVADVEILRRLPPSVFWPRPQVASAFVLVKPNAAKRAHVGDVARFRSFLRDLYVHRRKNLRGALAGAPSGRRSKEDVDRRLAKLGIDVSLRAETLDVEQHLRLCAAFCE
ncbi:MAG TPA: 16S rRNA (adenine(1518)-N(6)/adenine(1519)-N(6))-dimethyltransferase RsmA [Gemmataceae bacterium]|nr:16S rRNA (adenine(1518)-N(6)/adenine(1519)-N(6))-dimethyltransferase RsmA [Gemmataceae bacterium]